jgi:hypothetical protein
MRSPGMPMHARNRPGRKTAEIVGGESPENVRLADSTLTRNPKSFIGKGLRQGGRGHRHGDRRPPIPPRRDSVNQSYPPLDFFTPLAPMWFSPCFPTKPHLTPGVSPCVLRPVYPYRCAFCRLSPNGS